MDAWSKWQFEKKTEEILQIKWNIVEKLINHTAQSQKSLQKITLNLCFVYHCDYKKCEFAEKSLYILIWMIKVMKLIRFVRVCVLLTSNQIIVLFVFHFQLFTNGASFARYQSPKIQTDKSMQTKTESVFC